MRVNLKAQGNPLNQKYHAAHLPVFIPGELKSDPRLPVEAVLEMARTEAVRR